MKRVNGKKPPVGNKNGVLIGIIDPLNFNFLYQRDLNVSD
jgi:hypothetical protein